VNRRPVLQHAEVAFLGQFEQSRESLGASLRKPMDRASYAALSASMVSWVLRSSSTACGTAGPMVYPAVGIDGDDFHRIAIDSRLILQLAHLLGQHPRRAVEASTSRPAVGAWLSGMPGS